MYGVEKPNLACLSLVTVTLFKTISYLPVFTPSINPSHLVGTNFAFKPICLAISLPSSTSKPVNFPSLRYEYGAKVPSNPIVKVPFCFNSLLVAAEILSALACAGRATLNANPKLATPTNAAIDLIKFPYFIIIPSINLSYLTSSRIKSSLFSDYLN